MRWSLGIAVALAVSFAGAGARAGDADDAEKLFNEGMSLVEKKKFVEACPKLEASRKLAAGLGVTMYYADCLQQIGRTASAYALFHEAETMARTRHDAREKIAHDRAAALEPSLPRLVVRVPQSGVTVTLDGRALEAKDLGAALPVDPGSHAVVASAADKKSWDRNVTAVEKSVISIEVPILEDLPRTEVKTEPRPEPKLEPKPEPAARPIEEPPPVGADHPGTTQRTLGVVAGGVGVVAIGLGIGFGLSAKSKLDASNEGGHCRPDNHCDPDGLALRSDGLTAATLSTVFSIAGLALAAGGAILFFTAPSAKTRTGIAPVIGPNGGGASVGGVF